MSDKKDKSVDILGLKSYGDAINTVAKGAIEGIGAFLGKICLPAAEEFGLLLRDKITYYRVINLAKVVAKAKMKIDQLNAKLPGTMDPKLLKEIVEESSWVADETLQDMWAGLLAGAATNPEHADDALIYSNTLKRLSSFQAKLVDLIYSDPRICSIRPPVGNLQRQFSPENHLIYTSRQILELSPVQLNQFVPIANVTSEEILDNQIHHGIAVGRFFPQIRALQNEDLIEGCVKGKGLLLFAPTAYGLDMYMRCTGYSVYPIEAYLLTRQHWCEIQDIDPFQLNKIENWEYDEPYVGPWTWVTNPLVDMGYTFLLTSLPR